MSTVLSVRDQERLEVLEERVRSGIDTFHEVGRALAEISCRRLYRKTHTTFEAYCREKWGFHRSLAYRLIAAAEVVDDVSPIGTVPANEAQARELVPLTTEQRQEVWTEATSGGAQPTAARLHELANRTLAGLPPEAQQEALEQSEVAVLERQTPPADEVRTGKIERALKWLARAGAEVEGVDEADAFLHSLDEAVAALKAMRDE